VQEMGSSASTAKVKKAYEPPTVHRVPLRPQEAVLGFCKNTNSAGPLAASCLFPTACSSAGS